MSEYCRGQGAEESSQDSEGVEGNRDHTSQILQFCLRPALGLTRQSCCYLKFKFLVLYINISFLSFAVVSVGR